MPRPQHRKAHDPCPYAASNWAECDYRAKEARGRCASLTDAETPCKNWATDDYDGLGYCGSHFASRVNAAVKAKKEAARMAEVNARIDAYMAWTKEHPSVWDSMTRPDPMAKAAGLEPTQAVLETARPAQARPRAGARVLWSARSGKLPVGV